MEDIRQKILDTYGFDIQEVDLLKEYKITSPDMSGEKLEELLAKKRRNWQNFRNGNKEDKKREAERHLAHVDAYEKVLRDPRLLKALFEARKKAEENDPFLEFARSFFKLVSSAGSVGAEDADFFFQYYRGQIKNKKAILRMLEDEFHLSRRSSKSLEKEEKEGEKKEKKGGKSRIIVALFSARTLLDLQHCFAYQEEAKKSAKIRAAFPDITAPMDAFLHLDSLHSLGEFAEYVEEQKVKASAKSLDGSREFDTLRDLFNTLSELLKQPDVSCNFSEFSLLVRFHQLTPYMYELVAPKEETIRELGRLACEMYPFAGLEDFLVKYFIPLYQNFNISDDNIKKLIKKARSTRRRYGSAGASGGASQAASGTQASSGTSQTSGSTSRASGSGQEQTLSFFAQLLFMLANLPFYLSAGVFETVRFFVWKIRYLSVLTAIPITALWAPYVTAELGGIDLSYANGAGFFSRSWNSIRLMLETAAEAGLLELAVVLLILVVLGIVPVLLVVQGFWRTGTQMRKKIDWLGIHRTNEQIIRIRKEAFAKRLGAGKKKALAAFLAASAFNIAALAGVGYGAGGLGIDIYQDVQLRMELRRNRKEAEERRKAEEASQEEEEAAQASQEADHGRAVITASAANIRAGAGTDKEVLTVAPQGTSFALTGSSETLDSGGVWYELYLDEERSQTGWVNAGIIALEPAE